MGDRDHSYECETCGCQRGGLNDYRCDCDPCETCGDFATRYEPCRCGQQAIASIRLGTLGRNLTIAGGLCAAWLRGAETAISERNIGDAYEDGRLTIAEFKARFAKLWRPGCGRPVRGEVG